ncbi:MAG: UvrD-helicase domain-containing protein [Clostridia bacterium]|nr:UvrD-helicase domain-containing protein [Clostridia bacterium]
MAFKPTASQQVVLDTTNKNIVVSASAGSGKTTLMIEKVLSIIEKEKADISKFVICTFTKNAGEEMKERLYSKLAERIAEEQDEKKRKHLLENYEKIELAKISTIDKICLDLVKKYFYKLKIDSNIETLSDFNANFLKNRAFKIALEKLEQKDKQKVELICNYFLQDRDTIKLKQLVFNLYENIQTRADGKDYLENIALSLYNENIDNNIILLSEINELDNAIASFINVYNSALNLIDKKDDEKLYSRVTSDIATLKPYFNFSNENKIKFAFNLSIFSALPKSKTFDINSLKQSKDKLSSAIKAFKEYFDCSDLSVIIKRQEQAKEVLKELIDFLILFSEEYNAIKRTQNEYEFIDIQHLALEILKNKELSADFIKDIDYIFVDEFQDVNYLQKELIDSIVKNDNLFLVGDVKQSIYGFRLCTPLILLKKIKDFESDENSIAENLNENFRSDKDILEFVNQIFNVIMTLEDSGVDYLQTSRLKGANSFDNGEDFVKVKVDLIFDNKSEEEKEIEEGAKAIGANSVYSITQDEEQSADYIEIEANHIVNTVANCLLQKIYDNKKDELRNVNFGDISILFRKRQELYKRVVELLQAKGFPVEVSYKQDVFDSFEVVFVNALLSLLLNYEDDISLVTVLSFPCFNVTDDELAKIRLCGREEKYFSNALLKYINENDDAITNKVRPLFEFLEQTKKEIYTKSVYELVKKIDKQFDLTNILYALKNKKIISNYQKFINELKSFNIYSLVDYMQYLHTRNENLNEINLSSGQNSIVCQTIHASKGLEYPIVIVAGAGSQVKFRPDDVVISDLGIGCDYYNVEDKWKSSTLVKKYICKQLKKNEIEEAKRLLYVALTRAKNQLIIIGKITKGQFEKTYKDSSEPSLMQFILSYLNNFEKDCLFSTGNLVNKYANFSFVDYVNYVEEKEIQNFGAEISNESLNEILDYVNYKYPHSNSNVAYKNTVSNILKAEHNGENYNIEPNRLEINEHQLLANEIGTIYHSVLEMVDFKTNYTNEMVEQLLAFNANELNVEVVKAEEIFEAIKTIQTLIDADDIILKEQPFIFKSKHNEIVDSTCEENVLVQGVIDLVIKKSNGKIILVDYKNTSVTNENVLKMRYQKQLFLYKYAIELESGISNIESYLFSIKQNKLIKID